MAFTFNGIGTRYYGRAGLDRQEGSYIATEWFVLLYLPLFPIRSMRVRPVGQGTHLLVYNSKKYLTTPVPLYKPHVIKGYAITLGLAAVLGGVQLWTTLHP